MDAISNIRSALYRTARSELGKGDPAYLDDNTIVFHGDPVLALQCFFALRNHGILPVAGGYLDQPAALMRDINQITAMFNEAFEEANKENHQEAFDEVDGVKLDMF